MDIHVPLIVDRNCVSTVGGKELPVLYGGLTPGFIGLYQINVQLSGDILIGDAVPVVVSAGGQSSQTAMIPIRSQ